MKPKPFASLNHLTLPVVRITAPQMCGRRARGSLREATPQSATTPCDRGSEDVEAGPENRRARLQTRRSQGECENRPIVLCVSDHGPMTCTPVTKHSVSRTQLF